MRMRYRILNRHFDSRAWSGMVAEARQQARDRWERNPLHHLDTDGPWDEMAGAEVGAAISGLVSAPRAVDAEEGEEDLETLRAWVRQGRLKPNDLVDAGRGWSTVETSPELFELVDAPPRGTYTWLIVVAVMLVLGVGALVAFS